VRGEQSSPVLVAVASSVADTVREIGSAFTQKTGIPVQINAGASGTLGQQLLRGAPADVFIAAAAPALFPLQRAGLVDEGTSFYWISNSLVVIAPATRAAPLSSPEEIAGAKVRHLAMGNPDLVPAGIYGKESLKSLGLWDRIQGRLVPAADDRAALAYVASGEAELGIVYATDVRLEPRVRVVLTLPEKSHTLIRYPAALVARPGGAPGARPFLEFLRGPEARRILIASGFTPAFP